MNGNNKTDYEYSHHFLDYIGGLTRTASAARDQFLKHTKQSMLR
jgi:hypothetical protein